MLWIAEYYLKDRKGKMILYFVEISSEMTRDVDFYPCIKNAGRVFARPASR